MYITSQFPGWCSINSGSAKLILWHNFILFKNVNLENTKNYETKMTTIKGIKV